MQERHVWFLAIWPTWLSVWHFPEQQRRRFCGTISRRKLQRHTWKLPFSAPWWSNHAGDSGRKVEWSLLARLTIGYNNSSCLSLVSSQSVVCPLILSHSPLLTGYFGFLRLSSLNPWEGRDVVKIPVDQQQSDQPAWHVQRYFKLPFLHILMLDLNNIVIFITSPSCFNKSLLCRWLISALP